jgi:hypothetical protein
MIHHKDEPPDTLTLTLGSVLIIGGLFAIILWFPWPA